MIFKKTLSAVLASVMLLGIVPVMAEEAAVADTTQQTKEVYDTSIFEGHATYIMEDWFSAANSNVPDEKGRPSGWDVEYRGGNIVKGTGGLGIYDMSTTDPVTMSKKILPHKDGKVTFETAFSVMFEAKSGFKIELLGGGLAAARFVTEGDSVCLVQPNGKKASIGKYSLNKDFIIKAILDMATKRMDIYANGKYVGNFAFTENCQVIDEAFIATPSEDTFDVNMKFMHMYINYLINETFIAAPFEVIPDWWKVDTLGTGTSYVANINCGGNDDNAFKIFDAFSIDNAIVSQTFEAQKKQVEAEVKFLVEPGSNNFSIALKSDKNAAIKITGKGNKFYTTDNKVLYENYLDNFWYTLKFIADVENKTADIYLNYKLVGDDIPFENNVASINSFVVETGLKDRATICFDDVRVFQKLPRQADYVPEPKPVKSEKADLAMLMYSMWREGIHYGWDRVSPYENREPYLGYYAEGSTEVADWEIKWLTEHGFEYQVYTWSRDNGNHNHPVKVTQRHNALMDGYLSADYSHMMKFALLYSYIYNDTLGGSEDFRNNVVPYWIEYYFKDPRYMIVDNKPIIYIYTWSNLLKAFGTPEGIKAEFNYLNEECKKLGFDGVMIVGDGSGEWKEAGADSGFTYTTGHKASSLPTMKNVIGTRLQNAEIGYVPSIAMGWSTEPWITGDSGSFAEPDTIGQLTKFTLEKFDEMEAAGRHVPRQIIYTCWNEWGEGHFFCPSTAHGFGYLQEVRNNATTAGYNPVDAMPTERAKARMSVLYPPERQALKILNDPVDAPNPEDVYVVKGWYFNNPDDYAEWKIEKDIEYIKNEDGKLIGKSNYNDPSIINEGISIPLDNIAGIRSNIWVDGGGVGTFFYHTDLEAPYGKGKKFDTKLNKSGYAEYFAPPADASKLVGATMIGLRFDPDDYLFREFGDFGLEYIEVLAWKTPRVNYYLNGVLINKISEPQTKEGVAFMSAFRTLQTFGIDTKFDKPTGEFTIKKAGLTMIMKDGSNVVNVNGVDETMPGSAYYNNGHFYVPIHYTCDKLGITITNEAPKEDGGEKIPFHWEFNNDNDPEGWGKANIAYNVVKDGNWLIKNVSKDPLVLITGQKIDPSQYKYVKVRMKNLTGKQKLQLYFLTNTGTSWGGGKVVELNSTDSTEYEEYTFDMSSNGMWTGTVTGLRFDPTSVMGTVYIDYIRLSETP